MLARAETFTEAVASVQYSFLLGRGVNLSRVYFFTEALAEFQHVNCMIVQSWKLSQESCMLYIC